MTTDTEKLADAIDPRCHPLWDIAARPERLMNEVSDLIAASDALRSLTPSPEYAGLVERLTTIAQGCKCPASEAAAAITTLSARVKEMEQAAALAKQAGRDQAARYHDYLADELERQQKTEPMPPSTQDIIAHRRHAAVIRALKD